MKKFYLLFLAVILNASIGFGSIKDKINVATQEYLTTHFLNATFMFADEGAELERGAKGIYSLESKQLKPDQVMPIASGTKPITAAAILKLQDMGKLDVHDKISKHLNNTSGIWKENKMPVWADKITIHDLLTHSSGLAEYFMAMKIDPAMPHSDINREIAHFAASKPLTSEPSHTHTYCSTNFVLLGLIIEKVSGKSLGDFFHEEFFKPLQMTSTHLATLEEAIKIQTDSTYMPYPVGYFVIPTGQHPQYAPAKVDFIAVPYADGGVISNAGDLIKWHRALHQGKILSKKTYKLMTTKYLLAENKKTHLKSYVGYGIYITELANGDVMYHHAGKAIGYRSESGYIPNKHFYYAILSNVMQIPVPAEMKDKIDLTKPENQLDIAYFEHAILNAVISKD